MKRRIYKAFSLVEVITALAIISLAIFALISFFYWYSNFLNSSIDKNIITKKVYSKFFLISAGIFSGSSVTGTPPNDIYSVLQEVYNTKKDTISTFIYDYLKQDKDLEKRGIKIKEIEISIIREGEQLRGLAAKSTTITQSASGGTITTITDTKYELANYYLEIKVTFNAKNIQRVVSINVPLIQSTNYTSSSTTTTSGYSSSGDTVEVYF